MGHLRLLHRVPYLDYLHYLGYVYHPDNAWFLPQTRASQRTRTTARMLVGSLVSGRLLVRASQRTPVRPPTLPVLPTLSKLPTRNILYMRYLP